MAAVAELANDVGTSAACQALCMPRASYYRGRRKTSSPAVTASVVPSLGTQVPYMDSSGIALADCRERELRYARHDADLLSSSSADKTSRRKVFLITIDNLARGPRSLLWVRPPTNCFIGSIGKATLLARDGGRCPSPPPYFL
jgi:hypothetical protein